MDTITVLVAYLIGFIPAYFVSDFFINRYKTPDSPYYGMLGSWLIVVIVALIVIGKTLYSLFFWRK